MTAWENSALTMNAWEESVRQFYVEGFRQHYENERQASCQDLELWEFLEAQGIKSQGDIIVEFFIYVNALAWIKEPKNREGVPQAVFDAYDFYDRSNCQIAVAKILVQERDTYAVRVGTPGEGGWLEIFDEQGDILWAALVLVDVVSWEDRLVVREKFEMRALDLSHWYQMRELSVCCPPRKS